MADGGRLPMNTKQFSSTFLDFWRNSRGYVEEVRTVDRDAAKKLLSPFILKDNNINNSSPKSFPECHPFGNATWNFAKRWTTVRCKPNCEITDDNVPASCLKLKSNDNRCHNGVDNGDEDDEDDDDDDDDEEEEEEITARDNRNQIQNQDTAIGSKKFSSLQNREHLHCDEERTSKAGVDWKTADTTAPSYNSTHNLRSYFRTDDGISSGNDNSGNGASQNVIHGHTVELVIVSKETELSSNSREWEDRHSVVGTKKCLGSNLLIDIKKCNDEREIISGEISVASVSNLSDVRKANKLHYEKPQIKPLSLYKCVEVNRKNISTTVALNLRLKALQSVLHTEAKILRNVVNEDVDVCGKVAILCGFQEEGSLCISVVESEVVGLYNYIAGTVQPLKHGSHPDDLGYLDIKDPLPSSVDLSVDLSEFFYHHIPRASSPLTIKNTTSLKEHYPVAWLLISPALGLMLDWQVQDKVLECVKEMSCDKSNVEEHEVRESKTDQCSKHWYNILVVVDEYRCVRKGIPQIEVYQFCANGIINLVNFDIN